MHAPQLGNTDDMDGSLQSAISSDMQLNHDLLTERPARQVSLSGASNFRDLGGYRGLDGRRLQWGKLYRSAHLAHLTQQDLDQLQKLGIHRSADFRGEGESAHLSYDWPRIERHALVVEPTVVQRAQSMMEQGRNLSSRDTEELMHDTYRSFVNVYGNRFAQFLALLQLSDAPLVFHCTAGKDRTGWAAALLLTALGVDEDTVMQDYLLTNQLYQRPATTFAPMPAEVMDVLWRVQASYLAAATDMVRADFGGMEGYLRDALGIDSAARERLAALYLEG